jgi:hypothetical protein
MRDHALVQAADCGGAGSFEKKWEHGVDHASQPAADHPDGEA